MGIAMMLTNTRMERIVEMPKKCYIPSLAFLAIFLSFFALPQIRAQAAAPSSPTSSEKDSLPLTPGDVVTVHVFNDPDMLQEHLRITDNGEIPLLLLGSFKVGGDTPAQAAQAIAQAYMSRNFLRNAYIQVTVDTYGSSSVTVYGYVNGVTASAATNGLVLPLPAPKPLLTVLAMAGGLADRASHTVIVRRADQSADPISVFVPGDTDAALADQMMIYPGDIVEVPRAGIVYVLGNVGHAQGIVMQENGKISLLQALSLAGGTLPSSGLSKITVYRKTNGQYSLFSVNVGKIVRGKAADVPMQAEDILWVPFSFGKNLLINGASIAAALTSATASGIIYTHN